LGIMMDKYKNIFDDVPECDSSDFYEKMEYKLFPDPKRMIPKVAFARSNKKEFGLTADIEKIKNEYEKFQEEKIDRENWAKKFDKEKLGKLIEYYQKCLDLGGYRKEYGLTWKKPREYSGMGEFNDEIERQCYKITFKRMNCKLIDDWVSEGKLYLFEIYGKDLSEKSVGRKNIHTLYFLSLFLPTNLAKPILRLGGGAEIFLRNASVEAKDEIITSRGKNITRYLRKKYDVKKIRQSRYAKRKYFLHFPIKINLGGSASFNQRINSLLADNKDINIIGIDRGEKNLLYYSVINQKEEVLEQGSLNEINGVNYFDKLHQREKERLEARQSWNPIEQIKDLKRGYLSCVIHKICELIEKYNAIVVLEDLNMRFKQIRGGIERSVYQQFEKALIDKLGYLVFKDRKPEEIGGALNGYQLAAPFVSFEKMFKQTGILYYTQADYTSVTDPVSGFRKNIYISNSSSQKKIGETICKFKSIKWDSKIGGYAFAYDPADFAFEQRSKSAKNRKPQEIVSKEWTVYSIAPRIERFRNDKGYWEYKPINLTEKFQEMFRLWGISQDGENILGEILAKKENGELAENKTIDDRKIDFYHHFIYLFNLVLQLRNSFAKKFIKNEEGEIKEVGDDIDFVASPVSPFFSTKAVSINKGELSKPNFTGLEDKIKSEIKKKIIDEFNGDANGAYNIARKGIIILNRIKENSEKPDLFISKYDWDRFVQK